MIVVDSCFFIALYDRGDANHQKARGIFDRYFSRPPSRLIVPWPVMYESLRTRMVRRKEEMMQLKRDWKLLEKEQRLVRVDDAPYREQAFEECLNETEKGPHHYRGLSIADRVIRFILADTRFHFHAFITFNVRDFIDVTGKKKIELISDE